ncbi:ABC transporter ATP-binding protein [Cryobacterium sp. TMT2-10]|nr:ABC transporter ATP-binding protein [Cryobacterium sp. TMT2-10]
MGQSVNRSAKSGKFVSNAAAARWPAKTTTEHVGQGTGNARTVHRSAASGLFVSPKAAQKDPGGTISQRV